MPWVLCIDLRNMSCALRDHQQLGTSHGRQNKLHTHIRHTKRLSSVGFVVYMYKLHLQFKNISENLHFRHANHVERTDDCSHRNIQNHNGVKCLQIITTPYEGLCHRGHSQSIITVWTLLYNLFILKWKRIRSSFQSDCIYRSGHTISLRNNILNYDKELEYKPYYW